MHPERAQVLVEVMVRVMSGHMVAPQMGSAGSVLGTCLHGLGELHLVEECCTQWAS